MSLDGERIETDAFRKRAADLLKLLALSAKHVLHRDQLVEMLWPGKPPADGANNLYRAVHDLRSVVGEERVTFRQAIVELHDVVVDADVFEAETRSPDSERVARALDLYTADLLPEDYDLELVTRKRELLRRTFVDATWRWTSSRMDKNIQPPEAGLRITNESINVLRPRHIRNDRDTLAASCLHCLPNGGSRRVVVSTVNRNVTTLPR